MHTRFSPVYADIKRLIPKLRTLFSASLSIVVFVMFGDYDQHYTSNLC